MSLFQKSVINKYLKGLETAKVDEAWEKFKAHFHNLTIQENIRNSKEEQYQGEFLIDLFVNVFGYVKNPTPDFNLTTELKNVRGAKKTDGAILKGEKALAVIELKGTNTTDLGKVEDQAFGYKNNQPGCVYVITSNFEKLRFYIDNAVDFEEFNLFQLSKEDFEVLWLCLSSEYLLKNIPKQIKDESLTKEAKVTKDLYKDYSLFRNEIFDSIQKNNPAYDKLTLFNKTQKLLDRFLFVFFAEDRLLLPPNSIREIIKQWTTLRDELDAYVPLYDRFKKYFGYMNTGHQGKKHDIFAYNGGLFAPDDILDNIKIDDALLYTHTQKLSGYDFESEVSVNILGHIFEHSLNEIEEIQAKIEGTETDKSNSKRKKDGVFYTPKYITKYIVESTIGKLCEERKTELGVDQFDFLQNYLNTRTRKTKAGKRTFLNVEGEKMLNNLNAYRTWLLELTICDPACGSGAFLNQALNFLIQEHSYIDGLQAQLLGESLVLSDVENAILENNLFGVDINEESVEIAKLSLWLRTAKKGRKLTSLNNNIKCGNSLIEDPEVAGNKAFNWKKEFPKVFDIGGFDVIIGNPPYVFAREKIDQSEKDYYSKVYTSAEYQINTYLLFIEKSINIVKTNGFYGLIVPNAWLMVYSAKRLREYILTSSIVEEVVNLAGYSFEGVNVETIILNARKGQEEANRINVYLSESTEFKLSHTRNQDDFKRNDGFEFRVFSDDISKELISKLTNNSEELDKLVLIKAGLQAYEKGKGTPIQSSEDVKNRPYDYDYKHDENTHKYLEGKDVNRYYTSWAGLYLKYGQQLAAPRTFDLFNSPNIIIREITGKFPKCLISTYSEELYLFNRSNIAILERPEKTISLKYIVSVLNSKLLSFYFLKSTAKSVRKMFPKIILKDLRKFPIKEVSELKQQPFIDKADKMLKTCSEQQVIINNLLGFLQAKYDLQKVSRKLTAWQTLNAKAFLAELKKANVKLEMKEEMDLLELFKEEKTKTITIQAEIEKTDKEIDQMVYDLYGLTEEEIKIVEEATV